MITRKAVALIVAAGLVPASLLGVVLGVAVAVGTEKLRAGLAVALGPAERRAWE